MDNQIRKFYDSDATGGSVDWYSEYTEAKKEIKRLKEELAALQPSPLPLIVEVEQDFKELSLYLDTLCLNGHEVKDAGHLWIAFTDKFNAFKKKILSSLTPKSIYKYFIEDTTNGRWLCLGDGFIDTHRTQAEDDELKWTNDANWAFQWNTREEAEKYRKEFWDMGGIKVTEHEFPESNLNKCTCKEGECCSKCTPTPKSIRDSDEWIKAVLEFHKAMEVDYHLEPFIPDNNRKALRKNILSEEIKELEYAMDDGYIIDIADAIVDSIYVLIGTAWEYGLGEKLSDLFQEVHRSNMSKLINGKAIKRPDGKVLKSANYSKPDLEKILSNKYIPKSASLKPNK